jgi:hypothetical protein
MAFFRAKWTSELQSWQQIIEETCREVWQQDYSHLAKEDLEQKKLTPFEEWRRQARKPLIAGNEFTQYIRGTDGEGMSTELTEDFNPITWWSTASYPSIR